MNGYAEYAEKQYDVAIVGASVAGCAAATLYARCGLNVILLERRSDTNAYKKMCTHYIQACALPTLRRLDITDAVDACGGIKNSVHVWTHYGWIRPYAGRSREHVLHGYNMRREKLDPLLREMAINTPGVTYIGGKSIRDLIIRDGCVQGLTIAAEQGEPLELRAKLVVGADGRNSTTARLSGAREKITPNRRVFFIAYFKNLPLTTGKTSQLWFLDPEIAYAFPCDEELTLLCAGIDEARLESFRENVERNFERHFHSLPEGPNMANGERTSEIVMGKHMHTVRRRSALPGVTLVGDALLAADPYPGVGIGWALNAAERLVDSTADALLGKGDLRRSIKRYEKWHHSAVGGHVALISSYSSCRGFRSVYPPEKLFFSAGVKDPVVADHIDAYLNRVITIRRTLLSAVTLRAMWVNAKDYFGRHLASGVRRFLAER